MSTRTRSGIRALEDEQRVMREHPFDCGVGSKLVDRPLVGDRGDDEPRPRAEADLAVREVASRLGVGGYVGFRVCRSRGRDHPRLRHSFRRSVGRHSARRGDRPAFTKRRPTSRDPECSSRSTDRWSFAIWASRSAIWSCQRRRSWVSCSCPGVTGARSFQAEDVRDEVTEDPFVRKPDLEGKPLARVGRVRRDRRTGRVERWDEVVDGLDDGAGPDRSVIEQSDLQHLAAVSDERVEEPLVRQLGRL